MFLFLISESQQPRCAGRLPRHPAERRAHGRERSEHHWGDPSARFAAAQTEAKGRRTLPSLVAYVTNSLFACAVLNCYLVKPQHYA
jgi:hypothetical protein